MKVKTVIETSIEKITNTEWFGYSDASGEWVTVNYRDSESVSLAAKDLEISDITVKALAESLNFLVQCFAEELVVDLRDIWKKVDDLEKICATFS